MVDNMNNFDFDNANVNLSAEQQLIALPSQPTDHPLYHQVETLIEQGHWSAAQNPLADLLDLYPESAYLRQLAHSARARSALLGHGEVITVEPIREDRRSKGRNMKIIGAGLATILLLCVAASGVLVWQFVAPHSSSQPNQLNQAQIEELREEAQAALSSGDYDRAVLAYNELLELLPNDPQLLVELEQASQLRAIISLYSEAIAEMEAHHWDTALTTLQQIEQEQPNYRDVAARIEFVQQQQDLAVRFSEAEAAFNQKDYQRAVQLYEALQAEDYGFQREIVQNHLFLSYLQLGLAEQETGENEPQRLQAALEHFEKALTLRPEDSQARGASQLLKLYLAGQEDLEAENWEQAISNLWPVYEARSSFGGGNVNQSLHDAYMAWGDEFFTAGQFEQALERYLEARRIRNVETSEVNDKIALVEAALAPPPTPTPQPTALPAPAANSGTGGVAAVAAPPTPTPPPFPYSLKSMSVRNNCSGQGYIHGVVWSIYDMPLTGVTVYAYNETKGIGPFISNPTNGDGIYQIILNGDQIEGLWSVQIYENDQPVSQAWGQRLGGECVNGAQELKVDWKREIQY